MRDALAGLMVVTAAFGCSRDQSPLRLAQSGAETWRAGSGEYRILSTHYERGAGNTVVYVMTYAIESAASETAIKSGSAAPTALPLIKYAYEHHAADRVQIDPLRGTAPPSMNLAVDLVSHEDHHLLLRYEVPAGEVNWRLGHPDEP
jgi:hypothetical protein